MALPQRPRSLMLDYVGALATIAVLALSSRLCLAWQAPTSPHSSRPCFVGVSSPRRCGSAVPFMGRSRFGATRQSRTRVAVGDVVVPVRDDTKDHRDFVDKLLRLTGDPLEQEGGRIVVFRGNPEAQLMLIGEAPGAEEDRLGVPFVGRSGQLLDDVLRAVGLDPDVDVYVSNIVRRRPIDNRAPTPEEMEFYLPLLLEEIRLVAPKVIVTLGASSTKALLPFETRGITKVRGQWADPGTVAQIHGGALRDKWIMPWFHPSYLLRNAGERSRQEGGVRWHTRNDLHHVKIALDEWRMVERPPP
ncbi:unnamed protein product [Pylaiella littoralis]